MVTNSAALAQRVEAARRREGVAKLHLSNTTGIKRSTLHRLLAGKGEFKVWQLIRISQHLTDSASDAEFMVTEWMSDLPVAPIAVAA
jgi:predicted transcriptional regulator